MITGFDTARLICSTARMVTDRDVWVCPILLDAPDARMGGYLPQSLGDYPCGTGPVILGGPTALSAPPSPQ